MIAAIAGKWFPYDRYDRCDRWTFFFLSDLYELSVHMETGLKSWSDGKEIRPKSVRHHAHVVRAE